MKEKIRVGGQSYEIDSIRYLGNRLEITFDEYVDVSSLVEDASIFTVITLMTRGDDIAGIYKDYNTVYYTDGQTVSLSNDGSVYVEPDIEPYIDPDIEPEPYIDPEPYVPTLEEVQAAKITEMKNMCDTMIVAGVTVEINGEPEHFAYGLEDQTNIKDAFDLAIQTGLDVPYHGDGQGCKLYSPADMINIFVAEKSNLTYNTTYYNQIRMYIESLDDIEDVQAIYYGMELPEPYLTNLNTMMAQAQLVIETLLSSIIGETQNTLIDQTENENEQESEGGEAE